MTSVAVAVARANKKDQLQPVATGLFCNRSKLCTRKYMYSLCTVQTKVSTVLQDESLCGRAGVGGVSGSGGHVCACMREGRHWWWWSRACGRGDGGGGRELCRRGTVGGGRWSQWS